LQQLFFKNDLIDTAIARLCEFQPVHGYWVGISGGKDSTVIYDLVLRSGVRAEFHHSLTTLDAPETIWYIRKYHPLCQIDYPIKPLLRSMIDNHYIPPTRIIRWCCSEYKERGGDYRTVVTGVRSDEGYRRRKRNIVEHCRSRHSHNKTFVHPILDWSDADVWEYIKERRLPYNHIYSYGFKRVGCVLCPKAYDIDRFFYYWPRLCE
jgi:phosphoadenosine phosphosulfate reductase